MAQMREATVYLAVSPKGYNGLSARLTSRVPSLASDEVAIEVNLRVPDALFKRPALKASVQIPEGCVSRPVIQAEVLDNVKIELEKQLGLEVQVALAEPDL
jgi:hypothetical protein